MVYILLAEGFEEIEALTTADILRRGHEDVKLLSVNNKKDVVGAHGITVIADDLLKNSKYDFEALILPGGQPGTTNLDKNKLVDDFIKYAIENNILLAAICAAPSVLGKRGYLKGKKATCYPSFEKFLFDAEILTDRVVCDGNIITSRGAGTASDFAEEILCFLKGKDISKQIIRDMLY